jgi:integrase
LLISIMAAIVSPRDLRAVRTRRGELGRLMWSDIDLESKTLRIDRVRVAAGAGVVVQNDPKTR